MGATDIVRVRREECSRTKHDSVFSKWEILIGPSDWENYSLGKDGSERYRIQNLPIHCSCPGLYELGVAMCHTDVGRKIRKIDPCDVIVVYLGQADNIRTRLQHYGRAGSHLDHGTSFVYANKQRSDETSGIPFIRQGPGLFGDIFSRGFPIVFRWTPMRNKTEAALKESQLLAFFDYAWNKGGNCQRRPNDILLKLDKIQSGIPASAHIIQKFKQWSLNAFGWKQIGIKINSREPMKDPQSYSENSDHNIGIQVFKFSSLRPHLVTQRVGSIEHQNICGVVSGNGSVCKEVPVAGRKRCSEHKGKRINGLNKGLSIGGEEIILKGSLHVCGVILGDGSFCMERPIHGRKRCTNHKGRRVAVSTLQLILEKRGNAIE